MTPHLPPRAVPKSRSWGFGTDAGVTSGACLVSETTWDPAPAGVAATTHARQSGDERTGRVRVGRARRSVHTGRRRTEPSRQRLVAPTAAPGQPLWPARPQQALGLLGDPRRRHRGLRG